MLVLVFLWTGWIASAVCQTLDATSLAALFHSSTPSNSTGGGSRCISGSIPVFINATNIRLDISQDLSQRNLTETFQELLQANSDIAARSSAGPFPVIGVYFVAATLCTPPAGVKNKNVIEILSHGLGLSQHYWDTAPGNSYADAAAMAGYSTLRFDRLGVGGSQKPDPVNVVQFTTHLEVVHALVLLLRTKFAKVVGVGHSVGSIIQIGATGKYPQDFDAIVLTGCSDTLEYLPYAALSTTPQRAKDNSRQYANLPGSYVIDPSTIGFQQAFFRYPFFDEGVFQAAFNGRSTNAIGDFFSIGSTFTPAPQYTGPVSIVLGQHDFSFCLGDCLFPSNRADLLRTTFFPAANPKSQTYIVPETGHLINDHLNAGLAFQNTNDFLDQALA